MNICFIINDWNTINPATETTLCLIHESCIRNHNVGILYPRNLTIRNNVTYGFVKLIIKKKRYSENFRIFHKKVAFKEQLLPIGGFDAIFVRKNPPLDNTMLNFLDSVKDDTFIVNDINGMRKANNKLYTTTFNDPGNTFLPVTHVSKNKEYLRKIINESLSDKMILKPLNSYGGHGVIVLEKRAQQNINSLLDFYIGETGEKQYVIMQEFIEGAEKGDIRVLLLNGKIIGAYGRVPAQGDIRCNIHAGGSAQKHTLTLREQEICKKIGPKLVSDGLFFVGVDLINEKLIEVNVISPGGIVNINRLSKVRLQKKVINFIEEKVQEKEEARSDREYALKRRLASKLEIINAETHF
ncbi:MAG: glutathione synthase [bacterium]